MIICKKRKINKLIKLVPNEKVCYISESKHHYFIKVSPKDEKPNSWNLGSYCVYKDFTYFEEFHPYFDSVRKEFDNARIIYTNKDWASFDEDLERQCNRPNKDDADII